MMKLYETRCVLAAWILGTNTSSIQRYIGHFEYRNHPGRIPMVCPRCEKAIPPGDEAWVPTGDHENLATCVGCADA